MLSRYFCRQRQPENNFCQRTACQQAVGTRNGVSGCLSIRARIWAWLVSG
ncbi:hypothetical protein [Kingella oralis]|nr:hypothetical protein [Kingella oralis]